MNALNCSEVSSDLALYGDGILLPAREGEIERHLDSCPVCREELSEYHQMRCALREIERPQIPNELSSSLRESAALAAEPRMFSFPTLNDRGWALGLMPIAAGAMSSLIVGFALVAYLTTASTVPPSDPLSARTLPNGELIAANRLAASSADGSLSVLSPADFASKRRDFSAESPSINPQGALMALTRSLVGGKIKDDEMVVVARVFGNGLAEVTNVVEPGADDPAMRSLESALESDPGAAPFVPASLDGRAGEVQVVLKFQNVNVSTRTRARH